MKARVQAWLGKARFDKGKFGQVRQVQTSTLIRFLSVECRLDQKFWRQTLFPTASGEGGRLLADLSVTKMKKRCRQGKREKNFKVITMISGLLIYNWRGSCWCCVFQSNDESVLCQFAVFSTLQPFYQLIILLIRHFINLSFY